MLMRVSSPTTYWCGSSTMARPPVAARSERDDRSAEAAAREPRAEDGALCGSGVYERVDLGRGHLVVVSQ